jgi:hypothetical protein
MKIMKTTSEPTFVLSVVKLTWKELSIFYLDIDRHKDQQMRLAYNFVITSFVEVPECMRT